METILKLLRNGDRKEIWRRCCGFLDLDMDEFLETQNTLLAEQLTRLKGSRLAQEIFGGSVPATVAEFREKAPITAYQDYSKYLLEKREDVLPEPVFDWLHTSGRSGEYPHKWIPYTRGMFDVFSDCTMAIFILPACRRHGQVPLREGDRALFTLAPKPYLSGLIAQAVHEQFNFRIQPPYEEALKMEFADRIRTGMKLALAEGMDHFYGMTSILMKISEQLQQAGNSSGNGAMRSELRNPRVLFRLLKAVLKARLQGRPVLPKDLWKLKCVACGGTDSFIYKEKIRELWGKSPWEVYGATELGIIAMQHWAAPGLVFMHHTNFWEFMPIDDYQRWRQDPSFRPRLLLMNELEAGQEYALLATNFHGGALIRYLQGDSIKVISMEDRSIGLKLPQVSFATRIDDVIDIGGLTRLTEKILWQAIEESGAEYVEWVAAKEYENDRPVLHLYLEPKGNASDSAELLQKIHQRLRELDEPYRELETLAGVNPLRVSFFSKGTFNRYMEERQAAGADPAHLKPTHVKPTAEAISNLKRLSSWKG